MEKNYLNLKELIIYSPYFFPENIHINEFINFLSTKYKITVITGYPSYTQNKFFKGYFPLIKKNNEKFDFKVIRLPHIPRLNNKFFGIFIFYSSFLLISWFFLFFFFLFKRNKKNTILFTFCGSPTFIGFIANFLSKFYKLKSYLWIQDFWPEGIITSNIINKGFFTTYIKKIDYYLYKTSNNLVAQSISSRRYFNKLFSNRHIYYFPSFVISKKLKIKAYNKESIRICYAGTLGKTQNLEPFLSYLSMCKDSRYIMDVCGIGSQYDYLSRTYIKNIKWHGYLNFDQLNHVYENTNFNFISINGFRRIKMIYPFKFIDYLSQGKPIIAYTNSFFGSLINKYNLGYSISEKLECDKIFQFIDSLSNEDYLCISKNVKEYFSKNFDYDRLEKNLNFL